MGPLWPGTPLGRPLGWRSLSRLYSPIWRALLSWPLYWLCITFSLLLFESLGSPCPLFLVVVRSLKAHTTGWLWVIPYWTVVLIVPPVPAQVLIIPCTGVGGGLAVCDNISTVLPVPSATTWYLTVLLNFSGTLSTTTDDLPFLRATRIA